MPTVLIADDNSNIQKMVALALKSDDDSIDVIAVGNGEAAIRKAREVIPDLILADIFMPVRGGYEVCELVKKDTRLAHIPVVLLAGAFDPFDEPEARRVGADGVLKKPFVPADPLISLVKELLSKSSTAVLVPVAAQEHEAVATKGIAAPKISAKSVSFEIPSESQPEEEAQSKGFSLPAEEIAQNQQEGAMAFGSVTQTAPETETDSQFSSVTGSRVLSDTAQQEIAHRFEDPSPWSSAISASETALEIPSEPGASIPIESPFGTFGKAWTFETTTASHPEDETVVEPLDSFAAMSVAPPAIEPNKNAFLEEIPAESEGPLFGKIHAEENAPEIWEPVVPKPFDRRAQVLESDAPPAMPWLASPIHDTTFEVLDSNPVVEDERASQNEPSPIHVSETPLSSEPESAEAAVPFGFSKFELDYRGGAETYSSDEIAESGHAPTEDEATHLPSNVSPSSRTLETSVEPDTFPAPAPATMDQLAIEQIVSRVIERMQPQLMEIITREILKPVVESLVRRQLDEK